MSDDIAIVDRLRINWTSLTDTQNAERNEAADEIERLRAEREKCHDIMESQSHQLTRMARDIEMFREMIAEMRERNNKLLHKLQEFEAREAE
jgi:chromosome segregation ATPase